MSTPLVMPKCCYECPACKSSDSFSLDGFDRGIKLTCGFTEEVVHGFYEGPRDKL
jgi:hypothetical protein